MIPRERNEWLDADNSEDEAGSDRDDEFGVDSRAHRASKRRKLSPAYQSDVSSDAEVVDPIEAKLPEETERIRSQEEVVITSTNVSGQDGVLKPSEILRTRKKPTKVGDKRLPKPSTTGVIYLSRVPPFMKPQTVKHLLEPYGDIGRIFLTPEDPQSHSRRVKSGGNKKRSFTDGWVEFKSKKDAKLVAETLNAQIIGGKKGGWYHDDLWNIKYLKGFKWNHLTEQIANENAERAARLRTEIAQTTKENKRFVENVERAKMLEGMTAKKRRNADRSPTLADKVDGTEAGRLEHDERPAKGGREEKMHFRQSEVRSNTSKSKIPAEQPEEVRRVLAKIF